jgi:hypothetical protein
LAGFWQQRQEINRKHTLPIEYQQLKETGRWDAFRLNWKAGQPNPPHIFWDSDVAKWIEAASYSLAAVADPQLEAWLDECIALVAAAQQPDGYLNVHFTVVEPEKRWVNLRDWHELYCAGHMIEAGVAHFQATGKRTLLEVVCRYADYIGQVFGRQPGQKRGYCGHEEIELALIKLASVTGERRYLELARYFVDERGQSPAYFDQEALARGEDPSAFWGGRGLPAELRYAYMQAHQPVREQRQVTGHAVRAMYLYSAMADLARLTGDPALKEALSALWEDVCLKKMYITGGIGPSRHNEGFTRCYDLPNETAYAETCASIGLVFWNHRMLLLETHRKYADVIERALYNGVISGVSLDGERFFYENPLANLEGSPLHQRSAWFDCACCPPNLARLLASLGSYLYSQAGNTLAVHLFAASQVEVAWEGGVIRLRQETDYPWDGQVKFTFEMPRPLRFELKVRLPGWCSQSELVLNGKRLRENAEAVLGMDGYWSISREWQPQDELTYDMALPIERVAAHPDVQQDAGRVALQRGPLVYCLEAVDHAVPLHYLRLPRQATLSVAKKVEDLGGVIVIQGEALAVMEAGWQGYLYRPTPDQLEPVRLTAIPYFAWNNRQPGAMLVWIPETCA